MKKLFQSSLLILSVLCFISCSEKGTQNADGQRAFADYVDTRYGAEAWKGKSTLSTPEEPKGFVYPGVGHTNPMMQLTPQTVKTDRPYYSSDPLLQGFRASHYPNGTAMSEYGAITIMPLVGELNARPHERASDYSHDKEIAKPYYYSVMLEDYNIQTELTGVSKAGILRFTFPASEQAHIVIDNPRSEFENFFRVIPERNEIEGYITNAGRVGNQGYTGREFASYFVARFDKPFEVYGVTPEPEYGPNPILFPEGLKGEYFANNRWEGTPVVTRVDEDVNFYWEGEPAKGVPADRFSVRYTGKFKARATGKHIFYAITDDYVRLHINGKTVIDSKKTRRVMPDLYSIQLKAGDELDVQMEYAENTRDATMHLGVLEPETRTAEKLAKMAQKGSEASGVYISFKTKENEQVNMKVGTSFIHFNQARANLDAEIGVKNFDQIAALGKETWNKAIGKIQIESTERNKEIFYTAMQRVQLTPRQFTEDGYHYSAFNGRVMPGIMYTDFSLWDTFRALHPLLIFLDPDKVNDMIEALLNSYDEGGWIPKWPSPGYSNIMHGTHGDAVIADAYVKGVRGYDHEKALEAMMKNATQPGTGHYIARLGIQDFIKLGYVPTDKWGESVIRTLEFSYDDFCIAQMAKLMGKEDIYNDLMKRSMNYINVLDPETKFIRGRNSDGTWRDKKDQAISSWARGTERDRDTYYRNITYFVPHDVQGLANFMGGNKQLEEHLDYFFANEYYYVGDEFSMHSPYLYNYIGAAWKTQKLIRELLTDNFTNEFGGLPGNEDCGQLSAWYIFGAMGFYPTCPSVPTYQIGSPMFDKVTMSLPNGKTFQVIANNNKPENVYIQSATLNGKPYTKSWIHHDDIMNGGNITFEMGPEPNKEWGCQPEDIHPSISKPIN